jgi:autotransporter-associated beta strand protein
LLAAGDGGAAMGGAVFLMAGGTLTISGAGVTSGGSVTGGQGRRNGSGLGSGFFLQGGNVTVTFAPGGGQTYTVSDVIADQTGSGGTGANAGVGSLVKTGAGTLVLAGANTYTGGTTLAAGTLTLANNQALGTGALTTTGSVVDYASGVTIANPIIVNSNTTQFQVTTGTATQSGVISELNGPRPIEKIGAGTLVLSAANTYSGPTTITAGTLAVSADNNLGNSSGGLIFGGGTLQFLSGFTTGRAVTLNAGGGTFDTNGNNATLAGVIGGSGSLTKIGAGTLVLSSANSYSGGTTLAAGTLRLENNQALGTGALTTTGSVVDYANGITIANPIVINSNTTQLQVLDGSATQSGVISELNGPRPLEKIGAGTLVLTAANTYTGPTTISAGTLLVNGSIASSAVTVNSGALLAGPGTVGSTTINNGGMFAPGPTSTPGSMTVQGNLAFQSGALYLVQVTPSTASNANATGSAALAGTVLAAFAPGSYVARNYTILSAAGGVNGAFNALTTTNLPAGFTASLSYTPTSALLNLTAALGGGGTGAGGGLAPLPLSINQRNVANALNNFFNAGNALPPAFVNIFGLTGTNLANTLTLLSGEAATGAQQGAFQLSSQFLGIMLDPFVDGRTGLGVSDAPALGFAPERRELPEDIALAYAKVLKAPPKPPIFEQRWGVWGAGYGGTNRTTGDPLVVGSHDLSARTAGGTAGLDYHLTRDTVIGFALAGGGTAWSLAQGIGGGKSDAFQAGLYGATRWGAAYVAAAFAYTNHWMSTDRFAFAGDHLTASFNAQMFGGRLEGGYRFATFYGGLTPYAAIQAQNFRTPSYSESDLTAGGFALSYNSRTATDTRSELGARFDNQMRLDPYRVLALRARLAWAHDWISDPTLAAIFQTLPGASFIVNGATPAKNSALTSAGAELRLANGVSLLAKFDGEFAAHSSTYAGTGIVRYTW